MKRILVCMLAMVILVMPMTLAEEKAEQPGVVILNPDEPFNMDLDGDGMEETIVCRTSDDSFENLVDVTITGSDGTRCVWEPQYWGDATGWIADLNGDGVQEMFFWGDEASSDYYTTCLNYVGGRLRSLLFADIQRGENGEGYFKQGYGFVLRVDPEQGTVSLCGSQDVLGTWFGWRTLKLSEDGLFEIADDGWWTRWDIPKADEDGEEELWWMTLLQDVDCMIDGREGTLRAGDRIIITGSDKRFQASFITEDGRTGILSVEENYDDWGWKVNDIPESEVFDHLGYAD